MSVSIVIGGVCWVQHSPAGPLHDLVQPLALRGELGAAPWGPGMYSSLGAPYICVRVPSPSGVGEAQPVGGRLEEAVDVSVIGSLF